MTASLRIGIVGCGRLAELGYVPALSDLPGVQVVAVADPDAERRSVVAGSLAGSPDRAPVAQYDDAHALVTGSAVDGVVIASPVAAHLADAKAAAAAGVVALLEKPPAPDAAGAAELLALSPRPFLGFNRRFDAGAQAARGAARDGGELSMTLRLHYRRAAWAPHRVRDDVLLDLGPHLVDWAQWISGRAVTAARCPVLTGERAEVHLTLDGATAVIDVAADRPHQEVVEVRDASGGLLHRHRLGGIVDGVRARLLRGGRPDALVTTLRAELQAYAHALRTGEADQLGSVADGVAVMSVLDAARTSAAAGGSSTPVLPPVLPPDH